MYVLLCLCALVCVCVCVYNHRRIVPEKAKYQNPHSSFCKMSHLTWKQNLSDFLTKRSCIQNAFRLSCRNAIKVVPQWTTTVSPIDLMFCEVWQKSFQLVLYAENDERPGAYSAGRTVASCVHCTVVPVCRLMCWAWLIRLIGFDPHRFSVFVPPRCIRQPRRKKLPPVHDMSCFEYVTIRRIWTTKHI